MKYLRSDELTAFAAGQNVPSLVAIMGIQGIGGGYGSLISNTQAAGATGGKKTVEQNFLDYMKKTPAQRMIDAWLKAHHLTEDDLKNMPPEKRLAIERQMAEEIKQQMKEKAVAKSKDTLDILA